MTGQFAKPTGRIDAAFDSNPVNAYVGRRIFERREALGLSPSTLAGSIGVPPETILLLERGEEAAYAGHLYALAKVLQVSIAYFFTLDLTAVAA